MPLIPSFFFKRKIISSLQKLWISWIFQIKCKELSYTNYAIYIISKSLHLNICLKKWNINKPLKWTKNKIFKLQITIYHIKSAGPSFKLHFVMWSLKTCQICNLPIKALLSHIIAKTWINIHHIYLFICRFKVVCWSININDIWSGLS